MRPLRDGPDGPGAPTPQSRRVLVLGLGNELLGDDAVGLLAARRVAELAGKRADHAEACVCTLDLLPVIAGYERLVVVDAYRSDADPPGRAIRVTPEALPRGFGYRSFHTLPFREMLEFGRECGMPMPGRVSIHGLCVRDVDTFTQRLSPAVEKRWRAWAEEIARMEWGVGAAAFQESATRSRPGRSKRRSPKSGGATPSGAARR